MWRDILEFQVLWSHGCIYAYLERERERERDRKCAANWKPAITWECDLIYPLEPTLATCGMVGFKPDSNKRCTLHIFKFR